MFLKIKRSRNMDLSVLKRTENYMCRISRKTREEFELKCGSYIELENIDNKKIILQVEPAYLEDLEIENDSFTGVFVTSYIANILDIDKPKLGIVNELTLGMDPEGYIITDDNHIIDASTYFNEFEIGNDCGLIEFRPKPSVTPIGLIDNLYKLINQSSRYVDKKGYDLVAASSFNFRPAGFHIHFGYNSGLKHHTSQIKLIGLLLDYILSIISLKYEIREDKFRRGSSDYGRPGDIKRSRVSFEYRVPGGRLMESPILSIGSVSIAEIVVKDFIIKCNDITSNLKDTSKLESYNQLQSVYPTLPSRDLVMEVLNNTKNTKTYIPRLENNIIRTIQNMYNYSERKKEIEMFLNYESTYNESNLANHWKSEYKKIMVNLNEKT